MNELKPCPFCGGEAKAWCDGAWYVECLTNSCGARTRRFIGLESATEAWNTRAERICRVEGSYSYRNRMEDTFYAYELSCGHDIAWECAEPPAYCPDCGRKVVEA